MPSVTTAAADKMKVPVSKRLSRCAAFVPRNARVADIGCDHGYLGISLLLSGRASFVHACDLRPQPLQTAVENAGRFGVADKMHFSCANGLAAINPQTVDAIVIAGMGGELIANILQAAPWTKDPQYTLILQPQSSGNDLRRRLCQMGYAIEEEALEEEGGYLYNILRVRYAPGQTLTPGQEYCSPQLLQSGEPLLEPYLRRVEKALTISVGGIRCAEEPEKRNIRYYETALEEIKAMLEVLQCQK